MAQVEQDRPRDAGRGAHGRHRGDVVPAAGQRLQLRLDVHRPRPVRRAAEARAERRRPSWPSCAASSASRSRMPVVVVRNSSPIPGLGVAGGFKIIVEDRGGRGLADLQEQTDDLVAQTEATQPGLADVVDPVPLATSRSSTSTSTAPRPQALGAAFEDVNQTLSMYLGSLYVNSFNIRPALAGHRPGRGQLPQPARGHQPVPGPEQVGADGAAGHAGQRAARSAARSSSRATTSTRPRRSPATCSRASAPATPSRPSTG